MKKLLSCVCLFVDVSFSFRINHRPSAACRVFKADVLRESKKNRHGTRAVRSTIEVGRSQSKFAYCEAEFDLGRGKIGRRRRIHTKMTKTITIIDTRIRIHTSTSRRVKVKSTFGGLPPIDNVCVDPVPVQCTHCTW